MPPEIRVNGVSLRSRGFRLREIPRFRSGPTRTITSVSIVNRIGVVPLAVNYGGKELPLIGTVLGDTYAAKVAFLDQVKEIAGGSLSDIVIEDGVVHRRTEGLLLSTDAAPIGAGLLRTPADAVTLPFFSPVAAWEDVEPTLRHVTVVAPRRFPLELGNLPVFPVIEVMGPATGPLRIGYRTAGGALRWELFFLSTFDLASDQSVVLDARDSSITLYDDGVASDALDELEDASHALWPTTFDPLDGDRMTSQWPTIESDAGLLRVEYWRAWA